MVFGPYWCWFDVFVAAVIIEKAGINNEIVVPGLDLAALFAVVNGRLSPGLLTFPALVLAS